MPYTATVAGTRHVFGDLKTLLAKATPKRAGDTLAGIAAEGATERVAAQLALADLPLQRSNIRPQGMPIPGAARALLRPVAAARQHRMTGVGLSRRLGIELAR